MKVLVIGGGSEAHAVAWKLSRSPAATSIYTAPGNYGTNLLGANLNIPEIEVEALAAWAKEQGIALTVPASPAALGHGVVEAFRERELPIAGVGGQVARRGAGAAGAAFLAGQGIPVARKRLCRDLPEARAYLDSLPAQGSLLIARVGGPGAPAPVLASGRAEAFAALEEAFAPTRRGAAPLVLIEEYLDGPRVSLLAITDGVTVLTAGAAQIYRHAEAGEHGPLTEGMGACGPLRGAGALERWAQERLFAPLLAALAAEGLRAGGVWCAQVVLTERGPLLQELQPGFGDLAAQVLLPCWEDDLYVVLDALCDTALAELRPFRWGQESACGVVVASEGYPGPIETGYGVLGLGHVTKSALVFHNQTRSPYEREGGAVTPKAERPARTGIGGGLSSWLIPSRGRVKQVDSQARRISGDPYSQVVTAGGRVLTVVGRGRGTAEARAAAYRGLEPVAFTGSWHRTDIGQNSLSLATEGRIAGYFAKG